MTEEDKKQPDEIVPEVKAAGIERSETNGSVDYGADSIRVLEGLEAVRVRPAMYIGDTDNRGLHHLIWEVVDNAMDEALAGFASNCDVTIHEDGSVSVIDDGRGIPIGMHESEGVPAVQVVLTKLHAGGKFDSGAYKVSGGLHGVGVSCVNALAEWLEVRVHAEGEIHQMRFERGEVAQELHVVGTTDKTGTEVRFKPDSQIFTVLEYDYEIISKRLREMAYLMGTRGAVIDLFDERTGKREHLEFPNGLLTFVENINEAKKVLHEADCSDAQAKEIYELTSLPSHRERFVIPPSHREEAIEMLEDPLYHKQSVGFGFLSGPRRGM